MKTQKDDDFDWYAWIGIKLPLLEQEVQREQLIEEAKKHVVPIFPNDKTEDIFNRLFAVKAYKNNKQMLLTNKIMTIISFLSAIVSLYALWHK